MRRVEAERLEALARMIVGAMGSAPEEAEIVADHLIGANLTGHDSHGVGMLPKYHRCLEIGRLNPNTPAERVLDEGPLLVYDGRRGFGQRVAREAMAGAIARAGETGVALMGLKNAMHIGRIGHYGEQAAAAGMVSINFVNAADHAPWVAPFGGSDGRLITNPICVSIPATGATPMIVLDFATSKIAVGKARVAMNKGVETPEGTMVDMAGRPTRDPSLLFVEPREAALLPFGEHKGYGLALVAELLAGAITGGGTNQPGNPRHDAIVNNMLSIVFDPARFGDLAAIRAEIDAMCAYVTASPPADPSAPVMIAGDPERKARAERRAQGVPIDPRTVEELMETAAALGLARAEAEAALG